MVTPKRSGSEGLLNIDNHPSVAQRPSSTEVRTRTFGSATMAGMFFEIPSHLPPPSDPNLHQLPSDDEIIVVGVRISPNSYHRSTTATDSPDELPSRPQPRSYIRRVSTRIRDPGSKEILKAVQMPRRDYKRFFRREKDGSYAGTEQPERSWTLKDVEREFGRYQDLPLRSVLINESGVEVATEDEWWK